jgi:predicted GH43/DUF377 family glycosyl hydrolase
MAFGDVVPMSEDAYRELFRRCPQNPVLRASMWPYPVHSVFNPGATRLRDGRTLLLVRCEDRRGFSHLCKAVSDDGATGWEIDRVPTMAPDPTNHPDELWGIEDPRITYIEDIDVYVIAYTAFGKSGPSVALAVTDDFVTFDRLGVVMQPEDKNAAVLPFKCNGSYVMIHRPSSHLGHNIWIACSDDLRNWGDHALLLPARRGAWWDANKIGLACPPIPTERGWLMLYHGVRTHASGSLYRVGLALLDRHTPRRVLLRGEPWIFGPQEPYEHSGDVGQVVFPTGYTIADDGDTLSLYYGAADTAVGMAQASIRELLAWIETHGSPTTGTNGDASAAVHFWSTGA